MYKCLTLKLLFSVVTFKVTPNGTQTQTHIQIKRFIKCIYTVCAQAHTYEWKMSNAAAAIFDAVAVALALALYTKVIIIILYMEARETTVVCNFMSLQFQL